MVKKRTSIYANMNASDLARITRERGLVKPEGMVNISEWADWLEAEDGKAKSVESVGEPVTDEEAAVLPMAETASVPDFANMNRTEVLDLAKGYGMAVKGNTSKGEAEDYILAALGVTEDQQAEMDQPTDPPTEE